MIACHQRFFGSVQYIDMFLIGCGGVGCALVGQVHRQQAHLAGHNIQIRVCGIANSRVMLTSNEGSILNNGEQLQKTTQKLSLVKMRILVDHSHIINPVIVDCTSSDMVTLSYIDLLDAGFNIVTANTDSMDYYHKIRLSALTKRRKFLYDTNVGAGLPVIENIQNLYNTGDKINGILSGSLSYIFGKLDDGLNFSDVT